MEPEKYEKAKELFMAYGGSIFGMARDNEEHFCTYKSLDVPYETEIEWRKEIQADVLEQLMQASSNWEKCHLIGEYGYLVESLKDKEGFQFILDYIKGNEDSFDSKTMSICISRVINMVRNKKDKDKRAVVLNEMLLMLKNLLNKPITVSDEYRHSGYILQESLSVEAIRDSIQRSIEDCETLLREKKSLLRPWEFFR